MYVLEKKLEEAATSMPTRGYLMEVPEKVSEHIRHVLREFALSLLTESTLLLGSYFAKPRLTATSGPVSPLFSDLHLFLTLGGSTVWSLTMQKGREA